MATNFLLQSPELAVAVIAHFMRRLADEDFFDAAIRSGASPELLDVLRSQARLDETLRAFTHPGAIAVAIDETRALRDLRRTMRATETDVRMEYLARNGATVDQLTRWYSLSSQQARDLREGLGVAAKVGRPCRPADVKLRDQIHAAWALTADGAAERDAYFTLHQQFPECSVAALANVVREHEAEVIVTRPPKSPGAPSDEGLEA
jgi:hypothetical protein